VPNYALILEKAMDHLVMEEAWKLDLLHTNYFTVVFNNFLLLLSFLPYSFCAKPASLFVASLLRCDLGNIFI
jgi:hypothetical protein